MTTSAIDAPALSSQLKVRSGYLRAANLEQHTTELANYIPTGRALDTLARLSRAILGDSPGHAWSLTGPYGAGKSSFAVFLRALLGPAGPLRDAAEQRLGETGESLAELLALARHQVGASTRGFVLATTTCQPEPVAESLLRGLERGVREYWPSRRPTNVSQALAQARASRSPRDISAAAAAVSSHAPLLILLDEFGKTLEHFATRGAIDPHADLFVLQELAERSTGDRARILLLTLQHLAFDDYVRGASLAQRREWGKIAGRFEDIPFLETSDQSLRLVAGALDTVALSPPLASRRQLWSRAAHAELTRVGLECRLPGGPEMLERCYPIHPVALLALPELCARLGQHGRTLFTFLASNERHTLSSFLDQTITPSRSQALPTLRLPQIYDFFAGPGRALTAVSGHRWAEIDARIGEAAGLGEADIACLKAVGLLNLLADSTGLRASSDLVSYALSPADQPGDPEWRRRLEDLEARGWLTYRGFADEYRLWEGSDVDLRTRVADAREQLRSTSVASLLATLHSSGPSIAGKHTQRVGMLRYFVPRYADGMTKSITPLAGNDPADGALLYFLGQPSQLDSLLVNPDDRPIVVATSDTVSNVRDAAIEAAAALAVLDQHDVAADRVARRELQDRAADARRRLTAVLEEAFRPGSPHASYRLHGSDEELDVRKGLSRMLSDVCDAIYNASPEIRNEMLGRRELTSQGARARRELLDLMTTHANQERLSITGYGPERAMYEALLRHTGLHDVQEDGSWAFQPPRPDSSLNPTWDALNLIVSACNPVSVDAIYRRLKAPPIGLKDGPIPVILTAWLLHRAADVAVYEDGTYQPELSPDLLERLTKTPHRFALKAFDLAGPRGKVLEAILDAVGRNSPSGARRRNGTVLRAAAPLLSAARALPAFTRTTRTALSSDAERVRDALLTAREPDILLFEALPAACELPPIPSRGTRSAQDLVETYARRLAAALEELQGAYASTVADCRIALADELGLSDSLPDLRTELRIRANNLNGRVLEAGLRSFIFTAVSSELDDFAWLEAVLLTIAGRPPAAWSDDDLTRYHVSLHQLAGAFQRVEALHFEAAARRQDGFLARRVAVTAPDGNEESSVVWVDESSLKYLEDLTDSAIDTARARLGANGPRALLAVLASKAFSLATETADRSADRSSPSTSRKEA